MTSGWTVIVGQGGGLQQTPTRGASSVCEAALLRIASGLWITQMRKENDPAAAFEHGRLSIYLR